MNSPARLDDFRTRRMNVAAECGWCGHRGVVDGAKVWRWFALHRWDGAIAKVPQRMRCSVCKRRPAEITWTPAAPTIDFGPKDEDDWKRAVKRARR